MKKSVFGFAFILLACTAVWPDVIDVFPDRGIGLQEAIDQARSGDVIQLAEGVFKTDAAIRIENKSDLEITADSAVWIICRDVYQDVIQITSCREVEINGVHAKHEEWLEEYECNGAVMSVADSSGVSIVDCELNGCGAFGVYVEYSDGVTIDSCVIQWNSFAGVYVYASGPVYVTNNRMFDNTAAIEAYDVSELQVYGNVIANNY